MAADVLGTDGIGLTIAGHSMGSLLALHWAARRARQVERVVTWGAPLYRNQAEARRHIKALGPREALFALEGPTARLVCKVMCCAQPLAAGWLAVAMNPQVPIPLARRGSQHTWESYLGGMQGIIVRGRWQQALETLEYAGVPVTLAAGRADPVPVAGLAQTLAETHTALTVATPPPPPTLFPSATRSGAPPRRPANSDSGCIGRENTSRRASDGQDVHILLAELVTVAVVAVRLISLLASPGLRVSVGLSQFARVAVTSNTTSRPFG